MTRVDTAQVEATPEYQAATESTALVDRSDRFLLTVTGRAPAQMLTGIVSGKMPPDPEPTGVGLERGRAFYSTILTPKGKVVTDLRVFRLEEGAEGAHLIDVPAAGLAPLEDHLKRYLPPRMAKAREPEEPLGLLSVVGPGGARLVSEHVLGGRVDAEELEELEEGEERTLTGEDPVGLRVIRNRDVHPLALDIVAARSVIGDLWSRLEGAGARGASKVVWSTLRMEKGRPAFGVELTADDLPPEAGITSRAVDHEKGCYTGQEVIVRVRDRGRVNRHLRGLFLGSHPLPDVGTPLFVEGRERSGGEVRSVTRSPRFGQGIALGYVRREAEPPTAVRLGSSDGPEVQLRGLTDDGWVLVEGDPGRSDPGDTR
jgi:tRNA-modifying protein YgfZ